MKDTGWSSILMRRSTAASLAMALATLACEGKHRPYPSDILQAKPEETATATRTEDAGGAAQPTNGRAGSEEATNVSQLQPSDGTAANTGAASCADGSTASCGPPRQEGVCRFGTRTCMGGTWGPCVGAVLPAGRDCSSVDDNDCDGQPDNRIDGACRCPIGDEQTCDEHPTLDGKGPCHAGQQLCVLGENGTTSDWGPCSGSVGPSASDACTIPGDDATCDGTPNGGCSCVEGQMIACGPELENGICQRGTSVCRNGAFTPCQGAVFPSTRDCGSTQDNDCDGLPDSTIDGICQCVPGQGNAPCTDPTRSRCTATGTCAPCQSNADCSLVSGGRNLCNAGVCTAPRCGDGVVQPERGETCDDGNIVNGDGCSKSCVAGRAPRGSTSFVSNHLCSVLPSGAVRCWGLNFAGQLGNGAMSTGTTASQPVPVDQITTAVDVAIAGDTSCAALRDGAVSCWGSGFGSRPVSIARVSGVTQLGAGNGTFCGRQTTGLVTCWGFDGVAQQAQGFESIIQIARGDRHGCALRGDGTLLCFGGNAEGECGRGVIDSLAQQAPQVATVFRNVVDVATGYRATCVRTRGSGNVQCVGARTTAGSPIALPEGNPQPVTALNLGNAMKVVAGEQHMCALTDDDVVKCWGTGLAVGNGNPDGSTSPITVALPAAAIDVGAGTLTSCALLQDSTVYCWGTFAGATASGTPVRLAL
jgi:cysteine-rich repeat protein